MPFLSDINPLGWGAVSFEDCRDSIVVKFGRYDGYGTTAVPPFVSANVDWLVEISIDDDWTQIQCTTEPLGPCVGGPHDGEFIDTISVTAINNGVYRYDVEDDIELDTIGVWVGDQLVQSGIPINDGTAAISPLGGGIYTYREGDVITISRFLATFSYGISRDDEDD